MPITRIDHLYAETLDWESSAAFWEGLGFELVSRWGSEGHRAGRMECGNAAVVLAEIAEGEPEFTAFFHLEDPNRFRPGDGVKVTVPLSDTHWGTRWIRVQDPEGRIHALEETEGG